MNSSKVISSLMPMTAAEQEICDKFSPHDKRNFRKASTASRLFVLINGIVFNILCAYAILVLQFYSVAPIKELHPKPHVGFLAQASKAEQAGLKRWDLITALDAQKVESWQDVYDYAKAQNKNAKILVSFERGKDETSRTQHKTSFTAQELVMQREGLNLFFLSGFEPLSRRVAIPLGKSFMLALPATWNDIKRLATFGRWKEQKERKPSKVELFSDEVKEEVQEASGPSFIAGSQEIGESASRSLYDFLHIVYTISLACALCNLVPYPALDGGQIAITATEAITQKQLSDSWKARLTSFGLGSVTLYAIFVLGMDFLRGLAALSILIWS
jgi:regulator of sigma E protease